MTKLTDNNLKQVQIIIDSSVTTVVSRQVNLNIPKGYAAKIQEIEFRSCELTRMLTLASGNGRCDIAVLNDPDDINTINFPDNEPVHDVIASYQQAAEWVQNIVIEQQNTEKEIQFDQEKDIIAVRNLRVNSQVAPANCLDDKANVLIKYTLEKLTKADALELLDIM